MDANGSRFHALLGRRDWRSCRVADSAAELVQRPLALDDEGSSVEVDGPDEALILKRLSHTFLQNTSTRLSLDARRGAASDRFGNVYTIADDATQVLVRSAGSGEISRWWPLAGTPSVTGRSFNATGTRAPAPATRLVGLAVTRDHHLVVGTSAPAGWWVFDLFAAGAPQELLWPLDAPALSIADLSASPGGLLWLLDRQNLRVWRLGADLLPLRPTEPAGSWPPAGTSQRSFSPSGRPARQVPLPLAAAAPIALPAGVEAVAIEALDDSHALLLLRPAAGRSQLALLREGAVQQSFDLKRADASDFAAHDLASTPALTGADGTRHVAVFIADDRGNQAHRFELALPPAGAARLQAAASFWPMRRFGGRALISHGAQPLYDFGAGRWVPLVEQPRQRFVPEAWVLSPVFDSADVATQWHRLLLDARLDTGTCITVASRAGDDRDALAGQAWDDEPIPYRRGEGRELPYLPLPPKQATWELLLQNARGRFLQLRLHLQGHAGHSPRLQALRVYSPRFSYLQRYMPAVYREDAASAHFLDGFLANVEGLFTSIEDRIAQAQVLFDWRTAPPDALDWLGGWLALATEQHWPAARKRRFIRHAMRLYRWRGTVHGLRIALALALDDADEADFDDPARAEQRAFGVRVIEAFRTRRVPDVLLGDATQPMPPPALLNEPPWRPAEGLGTLLVRWRRWSGQATADSLPLVAPTNATQAEVWRSFCETVLGFEPRGAALELGGWQEHLAQGFVDIDALNSTWRTAYGAFEQVPLPADHWAAGDAATRWQTYVAAESAASEARRAWQQFLRARYMGEAALNRAWGTRWPAFEAIALPGELPAAAAALADWFQFEGQVLAMRSTAHRFTVLLPMPEGDAVQPGDAELLLARARRVIEQEKPAHTRFTLRLYWAMFRVGEARLGLDTRLDGPVRERLLQPSVLGRAWLGETWLPLPPALLEGRTLAGGSRLGVATAR